MFHFPLKERDQREEKIDIECAILEYIIIVSNTIKISSIFISLVPVPFGQY